MSNPGIKTDVQEVVGFFILARTEDPSLTFEIFLEGIMAAAVDIGDQDELARIERVANYMGPIGAPDSPRFDNVVPLFGRTATKDIIMPSHQ